MDDDDFLSYEPPARVASPCVNVCEIDRATRLCRGCLRSIGEIAEWPNATDPRRQAILDAIAIRGTGAR